jgi:nucleoside-diphosphate-sugar epimerase
MKVLFIGGTGIISTACTALAIERGIELYHLNRGQKQADIPRGVKTIRADVRDVAATKSALREHKFDAVVDWIAFTKQHVETSIELFAGKTAQYIFISSASAYHKPPGHYLITESTPLSNPYWQYSRDKIECEERLTREYREKNFPITIVRPSHTFGETIIPHGVGSWQHSWTIADRMLKGRPIIVHGDGTSLWVMTHNTDYAKAFNGLLGNPQTIGHAFHITTDEVHTWDQIHETIGAALGVEPKLVHIASETIVKHRPDELGSLIGDKSNSVVFDNTKIKRFVPDYVATVPLLEGMRRSIAWFKADAKRQTIDEPANQWMDALIESQARGRGG